MAEEAAAKADACKEYQSSLEDLTFNSKPHINNLTILAEENLKYSSEIVKLIEAQITKASTSEKLPIMYLMDSIVKNVGGSYISLFAQNIVSTFACVFEKVDESTRKSLFKLRSTWDDMFPLKRLYALDVKVNKLDPAWPIKPLPPNVNSSSIHVNPKFLNRSLEESATSSPTVVTPVSSAKHNIAESQKNVIQEQEQFIRQQLLAKQKQLLELQQKKLELELEQTKAQLVASLASQQPDPGVSLGHSKQHVPITKVSPMLSSVTAKPTPAPIKPLQQTSAQPDKSQSMHAHDTKVSNRDPRINRLNQHSAQTKDPAKKDSLLQAEKFDKPANRTNSPTGEISANLKSENHTNTSKQEKDKSCDKSLKKVSEGKSKLLSPVKNKLSVKSAKKADSEKGKSEINRRDPRLRKSSQDKSDNKSEIKEKRRSAEKKVEEDHNKGTDRKSTPRNKTVNGTVLKHEKDGKEIEKDGSKSVGLNFRLRARSSRSQSPRSRSPISRFVRQRGRLSPKRRRTSVSPLSKTVPEKEKPVKKHDEKQNADNWEQDRKKTGKAEARDTRRSKRTREDRVQDPQGTRPETRNSPRMSPEPKENAENWHDPPSVKRWKSGWEEAKSLHQKQETSTRTKLTYQQQRDAHAGNKGVLSPRTPRQQRMSVDANLQIPKELTSANKRDLLRKANQRLANGEIGYEEFLVVAHQINQLFQYQEEKNRSSDSQWGGGKKLKGETSSARSQTKNAKLSERLRELTDGPGQSKPGNLERLRTDKSIEPEAWEAERPWLPGRDGSPKCDGRIAGSRMRLDNLPGPGVLQRIDGAPELSGLRVEGHAGQPGQRFEGSQPGQTISCFDNSQPGARFDGPSSHSGDPRLWVEGPTGRSGQSNFDGLGRHSGQPGVRFDNPDSARTLQPGMRFDNPDARLGQLGVRFDSPRPGHPSMRFDNPDVRIGQPGVRFDSPRPNLLGLRFDGPRSLQPGIRFDNPDSRMGQPGVRFDSPRAAQPGVRFDGSGIRPGQPGIRFDNAHQGQPGLRFDGPGNHPRQSGMRFDSPVGHQVQHGIRFDGPHPRHPGVHFDGNPGFRFGAAAGHFDGHLGPQFDRGAAQPDPRINVPGHLFNGHASSQFQGTVLTGQPGLRFNMAPGMHYNESPSHGGTMLGNSTYGLSGPCFDGLPFAPRENHLGQLDVNELFAKLLSTGILKANPTETIQTQGESQAQPAVEEEEEEEEEEDNEENIPDLTNFNIDELKQRYDSVINRLYTGIQCYSCGMRFTESQTDVYADHLDWHYRMNRMEKDITKKVTHRKWYYSLTDWIEFEEIADLEERAKSQFFEKVHEEVIQRTQEAAKEKEFQSVPAGPAGVQEICEICQEPFEQYWDEDEEEWHLKNAVRVEGRVCIVIYFWIIEIPASITDSTPSPSEAPIENPLHSIIGIVKQEKLDSCETLDSTISCKNEESEDSSMLTDIKTEIESDTAVVKLEKV
uniref:Pre-mRNA cleavage complex 2 protein Pcf11 n=1 Tax=Callorhinchus milii TaxID=7868 RepID=A0A4W3JWC6_CALMI